MKTVIFNNSIGTAPEMIAEGRLVCVPTETVYGIACNGLDEKAVNSIYEIKGRPAVKPLSLMVYGAEQVSEFCDDIPQQAFTLANSFWPGPLTIILKAKPFIPSIVLAGGTTVGLRCPDNKLTLALIKEAGVPLAAPSANPSGAESPKNAEKVKEYFDGIVDGIIDGGECSLGFESTIIDMTATPYRILRQGALKKEKIIDSLRSKLVVFGITGPTGSGKTTVLDYYRKSGCFVIDCDKVYHSLLNDNAEMLAEISESFPECITKGNESEINLVTEKVIINRKLLANVVFNDNEKLEKLNDITHKYVIEEVERLLGEYAMSGGIYAAVDASELLSTKLSDLCFKKIAVIADKDIRCMRIIQRDSIGIEFALERINAQHKDDYFTDKCDITLYNNGSEKDLLELCQEKLGRLMYD